VPLFNASILRRNTNMPSCNVKVVTYHNATRYFSTLNVTSNMLRCDMQTCHLFFVATHFSQPPISRSHSFLAAIYVSLLIVPLFNASILQRNTNMPSRNLKVVTYHNATRYFSTINVTSNMLRCDMQTCHLFLVATHFSQPFISSSHSFLAAIHFSQPPK